MNASDYSVELRDKNGNLKTYLTPFVTNLSWEWNRLGGCGRCSMTVNKPYRDILFDSMDDIQIRTPNDKYDPYTKLLSHFNGVDGATAYTAETGQAFTFAGSARLNTAQSKFGGSSLQLATQQIVNGDFETWSGGPSSAPDSWPFDGASATIAREEVIIKSGTYSVKITRNGMDCWVSQNFAASLGINFWKGKTVTFGCWVYATVANRARIEIFDGVQDLLSSYHTGDSTWQYLTVTIVVSSSATTLTCYCTILSGDTSVYFDDASVLYNIGNYVTLPDSDDWNFGTGDFTIDFWVRFADPTSDGIICGQYEDATNFWYLYKNTHANGDNLYLVFEKGGVLQGRYTMEAWTGCASGQWYHIAVVRTGSAGKIFINGVSQALTENNSFSTNDLGNYTAVLCIGAYASSSYFIQGWIDEFRISKGIARWTSDFTLPPVPYTYENVSATKLAYRGFIANIIPSLKIPQNVVLDVRGYFDLLKKIVVHDDGDIKTYTSQEVSVIVKDVVDNFITPNTPITKDIYRIDVGDFTIDSMQFLDTVDAVLQKLAELTGDIEYGVDENLEFFWMLESTSIRTKFFVGNNVSLLERRVNWDDLVNKLYLVGGETAGVKYKRTAENTDSQSQYYLSEKIINNGSIITDTVADQYLGAILTEKSNPVYNIRAKVLNTPLRLEDTVPIGLVSVYDATYDRDSAGDIIGDIIGEAADGGSDIIVGEIGDGGSDITVGGQYSAQIDRIEYTLSNTSGRFNLEINLGDTILETAAKIKRLELALANLQVA
jgi:hypothetical protein